MDENQNTGKSWQNQLQDMWWKITSFAQGKSWGSTVEFTFWVTKWRFISMLLIALASLAAAWAAGYLFVWTKYDALEKSTQGLKELNHYDLTFFNDSDIMADRKDNPIMTIDDMLTYYKTVKTENERLGTEVNAKTSMYSEFLRNLLLPSLNIWKNMYSWGVNTDIIGKAYLEVNPYQDIALLSQWSSIIKESWKEVWDNEVTNMQIGEIDELDNWYFRIPISVSFTSNSKRAFLLLVDKLSLTSNTNNLWLLNDFCYYLFGIIRQERPDEIDDIAKEYGMKKGELEDEEIFRNKVIGRYLYTWIKEDGEVDRLIDDKLLVEAITGSVSCSDATDLECFFYFRDKYRSIPELAYAVWADSIENRTEALKLFFQDIPPLISIDSFTFDRSKAQTVNSTNDGNEYVGNVNFSIYGRGLTDDESNEITQELVDKCFWSGDLTKLDVDNVLWEVQYAIEQIWDKGVEQMWKLIELRETLTEDQKTYNTLSPYNKMIRKFEYYRMLEYIGLCNDNNR